MKGILLVSDNCEPCAPLKEELSSLIALGEVELVNFEKDPTRVAELMEKHGVGLPGLIIMGSNGQVIATS